MLKLGFRSHIGDGELKMVGLQKGWRPFKQLKLDHVFKIYNKLAPEYLHSLALCAILTPLWGQYGTERQRMQVLWCKFIVDFKDMIQIFFLGENL